MFKLICVTNRKMCDDFLLRLGELYENGIEVILREKDLSEGEYEVLAKQAAAVCPNVTLHTYTDTAKKLGIKKVHVPFSRLEKNMDFETVGVSVHSVEEAKTAEMMGADYAIAGHIFATDCKKGLAPRGTDFLRAVVNSVSIPVYAIGGIMPDNIALVKEAGAKGACIMSGFMKCENVKTYIGVN